MTTVEEYHQNDFADDSDDERNIRQADARALQKKRRLQRRTLGTRLLLTSRCFGVLSKNKVYGVDVVYSVRLKRLYCSIYFRPQEVPGGDKFQIVKNSVGNFLAGWSATSRTVIPVCDSEQEEFSGERCHVFSKWWRGHENPRICCCHIPPKPGSDLGPWNCSRWDTFGFLAL